MVLSGQRELSWFRRQFAIQGLPEELAFNEAGRQHLTYPLRVPDFLSDPRLTPPGRQSQRRGQREEQ